MNARCQERRFLLINPVEAYQLGSVAWSSLFSSYGLRIVVAEPHFFQHVPTNFLITKIGNFRGSIHCLP